MKKLAKNLDIMLKTGEAIMGSNSVMKRLLTGKAKLILFTENCPDDIKERVVYYSKLAKTPCHEVKASSLELGSMCKTQYPVSVMAIINQGDSEITELFK